MSDKQLRKQFTQDQRILRRMITDCLKYLSKPSRRYMKREDVEVYIQSYNTTYNNVSISEIIEGIDPKDYTSTYIRGKSYQDNEGYEEAAEIELYYYRKQTDQEYFDSICQYILPTDYQQQQYQQYLRLKSIFEKEE